MTMLAKIFYCRIMENNHHGELMRHAANFSALSEEYIQHLLDQIPESCRPLLCTSHVRQLLTTDFFLASMCPPEKNLIEHRHEDKPSLKFRWIAHFRHELMDFVAAMW